MLIEGCSAAKRGWESWASVLMPVHQRRGVNQTVLRIPVRTGVRHHDGGNGPQPSNDLSCLVETAHMDITSSEIAIRLREARIFLDGEAQFRYRFIEAPADEISLAQHEKRGAYQT